MSIGSGGEISTTTSAKHTTLSICLNYSSQEDEIVLVGFSRGAFAVRAVASLISDVGVLKKTGLVSLKTIYNGWRFQHHDDQFAIAMKDVADSLFILFLFYIMFNVYIQPFGYNRDPADSISVKKTASFLKDLRKNLSRTGKLFNDIFIKACTVVVAFPSFKLSFINDTIASKIGFAIHTLTLNKERTHFTSLLWKEPTLDSQTLKQCWFLGTYSGVSSNSKNLELGNISLAWMIAQLATIVTFDTTAIYDITIETINTVLKVKQGNGLYKYGFVLQLTN